MYSFEISRPKSGLDFLPASKLNGLSLWVQYSISMFSLISNPAVQYLSLIHI